MKPDSSSVRSGIIGKQTEDVAPLGLWILWESLATKIPLLTELEDATERIAIVKWLGY
jgi:hypothetical protein